MINKKWNLSPHNVVIRFAPLSGGRFVINMLSYFDKFIFPGPIGRIIDSRKEQNFTDIEIKTLFHHLKINSIPHKEVRQFWPIFEIGNKAFWGFRLIDLIQEEHYDRESISISETYNLIWNLTLDLLDRYHGFHLIHESSYGELKRLMPNCKIVTLVEASELQKISSKFKLHHWKSTRHLDPLTGPDTYIFNMKNIFKKNTFFDELSQLAYELSGDKNFDPRMEEYYDKYVRLHLDV